MRGRWRGLHGRVRGEVVRKQESSRTFDLQRGREWCRRAVGEADVRAVDAGILAVVFGARACVVTGGGVDGGDETCREECGESLLEYVYAASWT